MAEVSYEVEEELGILSENTKTGNTKELNRISYNNPPAKFDLREWAPRREKMYRGITLNEAEARELGRLLYNYFKNHSGK